MNKIFLDDLPKWGKEGHGKEGTFNWKESIGYKVNFIYKDVDGEIEIINYNPNNRNIIVKYKNNIPYEMTASSFRQCRLGGLLKDEFEFKYNEQNIKRVDLRLLSRSSNGGIDWGKSIGEYFDFYYDDLNGKILIIDYNPKKQKAKLKYNDKILDMCTTDIISGKIGNLIGKWHTDFTYKIGDIIHTNFCIIEIIEQFKKYEESHHGNMKWYKFKCCGCGWDKGEIRENDLKRNRGSCPKCGDKHSYPNKIAFNLLEQLGINFTPEFSPDWIKPKRYDFYFELNDKDYILEMDGGFHYKNNNMNGKSVKSVTKIDDYKELLAKENNIEIIRIECLKSDLEYIKNNILNSKLNELINLNNIDWLECHKFASKSRIYEASDIYNKNKHLSPREIGTIMKVSNTTARKFLKQAHDLGLCDYVANNGSSKKIKVLYNNNEIIYNSSVELEKCAKEVYGFNIFTTYIPDIIRNKKEYYGIKIEYVI